MADNKIQQKVFKGVQMDLKSKGNLKGSKKTKVNKRNFKENKSILILPILKKFVSLCHFRDIWNFDTFC